MHVNRHSNAFYISEKVDNDRSPKWNLNLASVGYFKPPYKEFLLRIWYKNLTGQLDLQLLIEMEINLNYLIYLSETSLNYSIKNFNNFIMFEIFNNLYCEPLFCLRSEKPPSWSAQSGQSPQQVSQQKRPLVKNSYTLNLMIRLHQYQRVLFDTKRKINAYKQTSVVKFDATSQLRQLQHNREIKLQRLDIYKQHLLELEQSIASLNATKSALDDSIRIHEKNLANLKNSLHTDKEKFFQIEKTLDLSLNSNYLFRHKLKLRQKQLMNELAAIFRIEPYSNQTNFLAVSKRKSYQSPQQQQQQQQNHHFMLKIINSRLSIAASSVIALYKSPSGSSSASTGSSVSSASTSSAASSSSSLSSSTNHTDRENAIALGHIAQSIQLVSLILGIPLRYPLVFRASKSFIIEQFNIDNNGKDTRMFALFKQTSSNAEEQFYYAIKLLNINIIQIRIMFDNHKNADNVDLLVNLKWIFDYFKL